MTWSPVRCLRGKCCWICGRLGVEEDILAANAALAASTSAQSSYMTESNFMQVDEVPTQAEVMSSFGELADASGDFGGDS